MKLQRAFDIARGDVVSLIGAGGKTSTLISLGHELAEDGWRVLATTTTRIAGNQLQLMPHAVTVEASMSSLSAALSKHRFVFLYDTIRSGKVYGAGLAWITHLLDSVDSDVLLIEADGARGLPLKAPYEHEPVVPAETSLVVPVASLSVLGQPLDEAHVYNAQAIHDRYGFGLGNRIKSPWLAQVLRDDQLGLRGVPEKARVIALLNQTPATGYLRGRARLVARFILRSPRVNGVALGSVRGADPVHEVQRPIGAIVLAAGMSRRMGKSKVLLPWTKRKTIIEHIIEQLILSRIDHITVVTGYRGDEVGALAEKMGVHVIHNPFYETGEMLSSLKVGLQAMPAQMAAALIVLGDQPRLQPRVMGQVLMTYAEGQGDIVAPSYQMRRGHPILIARRYWPELVALPEGGAPRDVINNYQDHIAYVNVDTDSILGDVDTLQDYNQERWRAGLGGANAP
jgi:molybdenum cofactor cytidylyltransferase